MSSLEGKVAVVTGARRGLGREIYYELERQGCRVYGYNSKTMDVTSREAVNAVFHHSLRNGVDILVNNAGAHYDEWAINAWGAYRCAVRAIDVGATHIVNIASVAGEYHSPRMVAYSASKAALISITKSLARKYAPEVLVNCVSPGILDVGMGAEELRLNPEVVDMNLLKKAGTAEEVARAVVFCCQAEFMTGQVIGINGGLVL